MNPTAQERQAHHPLSITVREEDQCGIANFAVVVDCSCGASIRRWSPTPNARDEVADAMARHRQADRPAFTAISCLSVSVR